MAAPIDHPNRAACHSVGGVFMGGRVRNPMETPKLVAKRD